MDSYWRYAARWATRGTLLLYLLSAVACSALRRPPPVVDRSADPGILADVERRLQAEPSVDFSNIRVEVDGGVVLLYGSVEGIGAWECAIRNAELVPGVLTVVDYLVIERGPRSGACKAPRDPT
jgi:hypothetical protein